LIQDRNFGPGSLVKPVGKLGNISFDVFGVGERTVDVVASDVKHLRIFLGGVGAAAT
jgi:hypothetical protein